MADWGAGTFAGDYDIVASDKKSNPYFMLGYSNVLAKQNEEALRPMEVPDFDNVSADPAYYDDDDYL
jgi:hypothetical protein